MENSDNEDDGNLDNLEDLDEEQMGKLLQLQVCNQFSFKMVAECEIMWSLILLFNSLWTVGADRA